MKKFKRLIENFVCENCNHENKGDGYTNHCSKCLCSKHVDINPGDRASDCGGIMRPVGIIVKGDGYIIRHLCDKCGHEKNNKSSVNDDFSEILKISAKN